MKNFKTKSLLICCLCFMAYSPVHAQTGKQISSELFGLFFEDINYAADGGLYAEMVQNRSFEYNPSERREWNPFSFWEFLTPGFSIGSIHVETNTPVHANNPTYMILNVEHVGKEANYTGESGVGIKNYGFDGMVVKAGEKYNFSVMARQLSASPITMKVSLQNKKGNILAESSFTTSSAEWKNYTTSLYSTDAYDSASLVLLAITKGKIALDVVSLFPENTFKNRPNGLRADLAQMLADVKPKFIRFPGGCLVHGDGLGNMYRWKNTIGPIEERKEQRNLWGYHQTAGLGFFEYFQFCEDIGAKPLPVLPAGVCCQNSGGTWRIGGTGQKALHVDQMDTYIQEVLDLIEWANGPVTSTWGAKRAAAGHPAPFNLEYVGIGNEDKITVEFEERFKLIFNAVKAKHPEIKVIGTSGPFAEGEDFTKGWQFARDLNVPIVDEHYYCNPKWFLSNLKRYDSYPRNAGKVYLGEYASWGNKLFNAISEAAYMTTLEHNGDVVHLASYAPLLAKKGFIQWKTNMIFFDNLSICPTPNYYVQKLFSTNQGDVFYDHIISKNIQDTLLESSCVRDSQSGDIILKMVNAGNEAKKMKVNLSEFKKIKMEAEQTVLTGAAEAENTFEHPNTVIPVSSKIKLSKNFEYITPPMSLTIIRIKSK